MYAEMMAGMMEGMMAQAAAQQESMASMQLLMNAPELPQMPSMPALFETPDIDWTEKQDQLAAKAKADWNVDAARRKTRGDTVLTSPLLDDDDASVTGSVLAE